MKWFYFFINLLLLCSCKDKSQIKMVQKAANPPIIDGALDSVWIRTDFTPIANIYEGGYCIENKNDFSAEFSVLWDDFNIYLYYNIIDDVLYSFPIHSDSNDFYNWWPDQYDNVDCFEHLFVFNINSAFNYNKQVNKQFEFERQVTNNGYSLEIKIPWRCLNIKPTKGTKIEFNTFITDNDKKFSLEGYKILGGKETIIGWARKSFFKDYSICTGELILDN